MALTFRRTPARATSRASFVAAATRIQPAKQAPALDAAASQRQLLQAWQQQSFNYYRTIPELHYSGDFYARGLQNLRLYVGRRDENNEIEEVEDNAAAAELLDDVQDPGGGRAAMLGAYGRLMWLIGEGYMLVTPPDDPDGYRNQWEFVSPSELQVLSGKTGMLRQRAPGLSAYTIRYAEPDDYDPSEPGLAVAYRYWRPDPEFSGWADAPMRGVLLLCDELERLTAAVRARAVSRPAGSGLLLIPDEISQPPPEPVGDEDPQEDIFLRDLAQAMLTPINDPGTPSAVVPMVIRGAAEYLKELRHLQIHDPTETYPEEGLRSECIRRIAMGLDMPPEVLTGLSGTNHWNAWAISEETWRSHLQPIAQRFCEDLTASYFRPACKEAGVDGWEDLVIWYDAAAVINHPDRGKDASDLFEAGELSGAAFREAKGFDDDDEPDEEERARYVGIKTNDSSLAWNGVVRSGAPAPELIEPEDGTTSAPDDPPEDGGSETEQAPPEEPVTATGRMLGAAELTVERCRELAGSRLRTRIKSVPADRRRDECLATIREIPNSLVASVLGNLEQINGLELPPPRELVAGGASGFAAKAPSWGVDPDVAALLADQLEQHAARTMYDENPPALPRGFAARLREPA